MSSRIPEWSTHEGQSGALVSTSQHSLQQQHVNQNQLHQRFNPTQNPSEQQQHPHSSSSQQSYPYQRLQAPVSSSSNSHYYYAPASPGVTAGSMSHQQQQPRQPPSLNIAAAAAPAPIPTSSSSHSMSFAEHQHQAAPYSAPANSQSSFYSSGAPGFAGQGGAPSQHISHGHSASYGTVPHHAMHHGGNTGNGMSFIVSGSHGSQSSSAHGGVNNGGVYPLSQQSAGSNHPYGSLHHRFVANSPLDSFGSSVGSNIGGVGSGGGHYDIHQHALDNGNGLLGSGEFDAHGMMPLKAKRKQVKNACINCQKACKRCDEGRPCSRCVKYGLTATCSDSARKERKRGIKRGPYKRRATTGSQSLHFGHHQTGANLLNGENSAGGAGQLHHLSTAMSVGSGMGGGGNFAHQIDASNSSSSPLSPHPRAYVHSSGHEASASLSAAQSFEHAGEQLQLDGGNSHFQRTGAGAPLSYDMNGSAPHNSAMYSRDAYVSVTANPSPASAMQPPSGRAPAHSRLEYDNFVSGPSNGGHGFAASSLYSNVPAGSRGAAGYPGSAPAASSNFAVGGSSSQRSGVVPHLFSPSSANGSPASAYGNQSAGPGQSFLGASGGPNNSFSNRLYGDNSSLATMSNGSATTASTIHSPRTPGGLGMPGAGETAAGSVPSPGLSGKLAGNGGQAASYLHHPRSSTLSALTPGSATAFLNPSSSLSGQPFSLHLPHSVRARANNSPSSASAVDISRPRSGQGHNDEQYTGNLTSSSDNAMHRPSPSFVTSDAAAAKADWPINGFSSNGPRYQLPSPRLTSNEGRVRPMLS